MDSLKVRVIDLCCDQEVKCSEAGGKAHHLQSLHNLGYSTPNGIALTKIPYENFVLDHKIYKVIEFEMGKKPFLEMRWEEIWDSALRIRNIFLQGSISHDLMNELLSKMKECNIDFPVSVRSSSPHEDSENFSYAGLHESFLHIKDSYELEEAIKKVWASLWSDSALLYSHELNLTPQKSWMGVVIQNMVLKDVSGVAFSLNPLNPDADEFVIEGVSGFCDQLVDGSIEPEQWIVKPTGELVSHRMMENSSNSILKNTLIKKLCHTLIDLESQMNYKTDIEWTADDNKLTLLQMRPITCKPPSDERSQYLKLKPAQNKLFQLRQKVADELIPQLEELGNQLSEFSFDNLSLIQLADEIDKRHKLYLKWKNIYWDYFIPFAHGVRYLGSYYNEHVKPDDPFEFVEILRDQPMNSLARNRHLTKLAIQLKKNSELQIKLKNFFKLKKENSIKKIFETDHEIHFFNKVEEFCKTYLDISFQNYRMLDQQNLILKNILELSFNQFPSRIINNRSAEDYEKKLYLATGDQKKNQTSEIIETAKVSWKLRDDDNLLLGKVESQLMRCIQVGIDRLNLKIIPDKEYVALLINALKGKDPALKELKDQIKKTVVQSKRSSSIRPRQLTGNPASPGIVTGKIRVIRNRDDISEFKNGEILVCDAIQPQFTHLVPLCHGIIERRGGMLIHGAIIAREIGIPCANGVINASELLRTGDIITLDGFLGIITINQQ